MRWSDRIGRRIKLRDLHVLQAVLEAGSMSKAANQLSVSVPVVSKAIADLEHMVGVRLLDRSPQGIEATIYGRTLLNRSLAAFDELRQGVNEIEFLLIRPPESYGLEARCLSRPARIRSYRPALEKASPHRVSSRGDRNRGAISQLAGAHSGFPDRAAVEFGIARAARVFKSLYHDPYVVAAGTTNRWTRQRRIKLAQLVDELWALPPPDSLVGSFVVEAFRASGLICRARRYSPFRMRCETVCSRPVAI